MTKTAHISFKKFLLLFFLVLFGSSQAKQSEASNKIWNFLSSLIGIKPRTQKQETESADLSAEQQQIETAQAEFKKLSPEEQKRQIIITRLIDHANTTHNMRMLQIWNSPSINPTKKHCQEAYEDAKNEIKLNQRYLLEYLMAAGGKMDPQTLTEIQNQTEQENEQAFQQCLKDVELVQQELKK